MRSTRIALAALVACGLALGAAVPAQARGHVPGEYADALATAQSYVRVLDISKQGLYDQLVSPYGSDFPKKAATYAVAHVKANYNLEALAAAKSYRKILHLSKNKLHDQLTSKYGGKFTNAQADYALARLY